MPEYSYKAKDMKTGKIISDKMQVVDEATFYRELEKKNLVCIRKVEKGNVDNVELPYRFKLKELSVFCREFSIMLSAGIPIVDVFNKLNNRTSNKEKKRVYLYMIESVEKGNTIADSMQKLGQVFPNILIEMMRIGETSGSLEKVIEKMAEYYEKEYKTRSKVQTVMIYPIILTVVTVGIMILLFTYVMPKFFTMFEKSMSLPGITVFFMKVSDFLIHDWMYLILGIALVMLVFKVFVSTQKGRLAFDKFKCGIPAVSKLIEKGVIARFASTMFILTSSGIVILDALEICAQTLSNTFMRNKLLNCREEVQKGTELSVAMEREGLFEDLVWSMMATGEETGNADEMYEKLSKYYEQENDVATEKLMAIIEPVMLLVIGVLVALVVASILVPIYSMYRA